ncbi:unnamed protein product [Bursaphelenchus xylophilus]|uniref:(pine wood nematode) hypothetical protein n=1 Tax=Bursaphelenchus xylophilus TaxID=6326 RepID=A0A1I7SF07_BURXY|nr:unnamed protein product [Bursaphelenchus xylophilus]CAG9088818.1 unnamed protein product [Bursaphelenchus xylophilus]
MGLGKCLVRKFFGRTDNCFLDECELEDLINRLLVIKGLLLGGYTDEQRNMELQSRLRTIGYMGEENVHDMEEYLVERIEDLLINFDLAERLSFLHAQPRNFVLKVAEDMGIDLDDGLKNAERTPDGRRSVEERCARGEFDSIF